MMQVPFIPLVTAMGRPHSSVKSRISTEAKKAFISIRAMARSQKDWAGNISINHDRVPSSDAWNQSAHLVFVCAQHRKSLAACAD